MENSWLEEKLKKLKRIKNCRKHGLSALNGFHMNMKKGPGEPKVQEIGFHALFEYQGFLSPSLVQIRFIQAMEAPQPVHPDLQLSLLHHIQDENESYIVEQEDAERIAYYLQKASFDIALYCCVK